jgi:hypothetical protein
VLNPAKLASLLEISGMNEPVMPSRRARSSIVMAVLVCSSRHQVRPCTMALTSVRSTAGDAALPLRVINLITWPLRFSRVGTSSFTGPFVARIVRLAFLSPQVLASVIDGTLPAHLTLKRLTMPEAVPARWGSSSL